MKDWKTTVIGVAGAMLVCIAQAFTTGNVDVKTLLIAAVIAGIGAFSGDSKTIDTISKSPVAQELLPVANALITQIDKTEPNPIFDKIHQVLTNIEANTAAAATASAQPVVQNIIQETAPVQEPAEATDPVAIDPVVQQLNDAALLNKTT